MLKLCIKNKIKIWTFWNMFSSSCLVGYLRKIKVRSNCKNIHFTLNTKSYLKNQNSKEKFFGEHQLHLSQTNVITSAINTKHTLSIKQNLIKYVTAFLTEKRCSRNQDHFMSESRVNIFAFLTERSESDKKDNRNLYTNN